MVGVLVRVGVVRVVEEGDRDARRVPVVGVGPTAERGDGGIAAVDLAEIERQVDRGGVAQVEQELGARRDALVGLVRVLARREVGAVAVALVARADRQIGGEVRGDRPRHIGVDATRVVVAVADVGLTAEVELRITSDDRDQTARGVAPEQRALRPFQHLHALDRTQVQQRPGCRGDVNAVDVGGDGVLHRRARRARADAADARLKEAVHV